MKIQIISGGYFKNTPEKIIFAEYLKRVKTSVTLIELDDRGGAVADDLYQKHITKDAFTIMLDEKGADVTSVQFAEKLKALEMESYKTLNILIGGANGFSDALKQQSNLKIRFGAMTWPHMFVRVMLMEQIYRAQQINAGHPYHKV